MKNIVKALLCFSIISVVFDGLAQPYSAAQYDSIYQSFVDTKFNDPNQDLSTLRRLENYLEELRDTCRLSRVASWKSNCYDALGQLDSSMYYGHHALRLFRPHCDSLTLMSINANLTSTYLSLGEHEKVIEIAERNLNLWNPNWPESDIRKAFRINKAIALVYKGEVHSGLETFKEILQIAREEEDLIDQMEACNNISALYGMLSRVDGSLSYLDSSSKYVQIALQLGMEQEKYEDVVIHYTNLSAIHQEKGNYSKCLMYLDSADFYAEQGGYLQLASSASLLRSNVYESTGRLDSALFYFKHHMSLKDSLLNSDKIRAISDMQEKYESEKKERQIKELEVDRLDAALREEQLTKTRNIFLFSGIGVLLIAGGLCSRLQFTRKAKAAIQKEKDRSEELLLNILPEEVAEELKEYGEAKAKLIDQVTVLFTDFKGFTAMSEILSPQELVKDLHECFSAFDAICEVHGLEKIKTIGDAYMAAGGLPTPNTTHATDVIKAALEMCDFVEQGKQQKITQGLPYFEVRIGIHTGPVVAGIVGVKKFQYDIWGDTVNTASRMESSGGVGQVNISEATYELVKDNPEFNFTNRGKIEAKGKGELEMLFVELRK